MKNRLNEHPPQNQQPRYFEVLQKLAGSAPTDKDCKPLFDHFERGHVVASKAISSLGEAVFMGEMLGMFNAMVSCLYMTFDDVPQEMMDELWQTMSETAKEQIAEFSKEQKKGLL